MAAAIRSRCVACGASAPIRLRTATATASMPASSTSPRISSLDEKW